RAAADFRLCVPGSDPDALRPFCADAYRLPAGRNLASTENPRSHGLVRAEFHGSDSGGPWTCLLRLPHFTRRAQALRRRPAEALKASAVRGKAWTEEHASV